MSAYLNIATAPEPKYTCAKLPRIGSGGRCCCTQTVRPRGGGPLPQAVRQARGAAAAAVLVRLLSKTSGAAAAPLDGAPPSSVESSPGAGAAALPISPRRFRQEHRGRPEICQLHVPVRAQQNVFWLQVSVGNVLTVQVAEGIYYFCSVKHSSLVV